jgi:hypothetical protein
MIAIELVQNQEDTRQVGLCLFGPGHLHRSHHDPHRPRCWQSSISVIPNQLSAYDCGRSGGNHVRRLASIQSEGKASTQGTRKGPIASLTWLRQVTSVWGEIEKWAEFVRSREWESAIVGTWPRLMKYCSRQSMPSNEGDARSKGAPAKHTSKIRTIMWSVHNQPRHKARTLFRAPS